MNATQRRLENRDINGDGFADRVVLECRSTAGEESCRAVQIEMGLADGRFVSVFNESTVSPAISKGDDVYLAPSSFYESPFGACSEEDFQPCSPGLALNGKFNGEVGLERGDAKLVRLSDGTTIERERLLGAAAVAKDIYSPISFTRGKAKGWKLRGNVLLEVAAGKAESVFEYIYAEKLGAIDEKRLLKAIAIRAPSLIGEISNAGGNQKFAAIERIAALAGKAPDVFTSIVGVGPKQWRQTIEGFLLGKPLLVGRMNVERYEAVSAPMYKLQQRAWTTKTNETRCEVLIRAFAASEPPEFAIWAADFLSADNGAVSRRNGTLLTTMARLIEKALDDKNAAAALFDRLAGEIASDGADAVRQRGRWKMLLSIINRHIVAAGGEIGADDASLVSLTAAFPEFAPAVFAAAGARKKVSPEFAAWLKERCGRAIGTAAKAAATLAAKHLGDDGIVLLKGLAADNSDAVVRFYAFRALKELARPTPEIFALFESGVDDADAAVSCAAALALVDWDAPGIAMSLWGRLFDYRSSPEYARRNTSYLMENDKSPVIDGVRSAIHQMMWKMFEQSHKMAVPVIAKDGSMGREPMTLKRVALHALSKFRPPVNADVLTKMMAEEDDEIDLQLVAQTLIAVDGARGLERVLDRIEKRFAPDSLFLFSSGEAAKFGAKAPIQRIFKHLFHPSDTVRRATAQNLGAAGDERSLAAILKYSASEREETRTRMAEALASFDSRESARRLIAMLDDSSPVVQATAAASIEELKSPEAEKVISESRSAKKRKAGEATAPAGGFRR